MIAYYIIFHGSEGKPTEEQLASPVINHKKGVSDSLSAFPNTKQRGRVSETRVDAGEELPNGNHPTVSLSFGVV